MKDHTPHAAGQAGQQGAGRKDHLLDPDSLTGEDQQQVEPVVGGKVGGPGGQAHLDLLGVPPHQAAPEGEAQGGERMEEDVAV